MPTPGRTFSNPSTGAWLTWLPRGDDGVIERVIKPHTGRADAHVHLDYLERFEILGGIATIEVDRQPRTGTPHRNPYNESDSDVRLRHTASPGSEFVDAFVSSLGHHMENDTVNE